MLKKKNMRVEEKKISLISFQQEKKEGLWQRKGYGGFGQLRKLTSAIHLAQGKSPALDQTVPCQPKLNSKKMRIQLLLSPPVLKHKGKIKEKTESNQSTLSSWGCPQGLQRVGDSPTQPECPPRLPHNLWQPGVVLSCISTTNWGTELTLFFFGKGTLLLKPVLLLTAFKWR